MFLAESERLASCPSAPGSLQQDTATRPGNPLDKLIMGEKRKERLAGLLDLGRGDLKALSLPLQESPSGWLRSPSSVK